MLIRAMGSIWTATFSFMGRSGSLEGFSNQALASNAANRWRGRRRGAIRMASKSQLKFGMLGMRHQPALRGIDDARLLARRHRVGGVIEAGAGLDLDEGDQIALLRHQIDLAIGGAEALGEDAVALGHQKGGGAAFGRKPGAEGRDPLGRGESCRTLRAAWRRQSSPSLASGFFRELQRAGVDLAARPPGKFDRMRHAVLDAVARKRRAQQVVEVVLRHDLRIGARRADHEHELAAGFQRIGGLRQLRRSARA